MRFFTKKMISPQRVLVVVTVLLLIVFVIRYVVTESGGDIDKSGYVYNDRISVDIPAPKAVVFSPLFISGEARGVWFFEGTFPIFVTDDTGIIIGDGFATTDSDWNTEDFISFKATIEFATAGVLSNSGFIIFNQSNPAEISDRADVFSIPILFAHTVNAE